LAQAVWPKTTQALVHSTEGRPHTSAAALSAFFVFLASSTSLPSQAWEARVAASCADFFRECIDTFSECGRAPFLAMGCCALRRARPFRVNSVVPEPCDDPVSHADDVFKTVELAVELEMTSTGEGGDSDAESVGVMQTGSCESFTSRPGESPEEMWARQARRQEAQARTRRKAEEMLAKAGPGCGCDVLKGLDANYTIEDNIGKGSYSSVSRCTHVRTDAVRALKSIDKKKCVSLNQIQEEIEVMRILVKDHHPHIIQIYDTFEDAVHTHIVMELCTGGDLFEQMQRYNHGAEAIRGFPEEVVAVLYGQIAAVTCYMHSLHVAHRDLKPENFMLTSPPEESLAGLARASLKAIDFGLSRRFVPGTLMRTFACTAAYVAPEILVGQGYTEACDMWSIGVLLYALLSGALPFCGDSEKQVLERIRRGTFDFDGGDWAAVGQERKELVRSLLQVDPGARPTAAQLVSHPWLKAHVVTTCRAAQPEPQAAEGG